MRGRVTALVAALVVAGAWSASASRASAEEAVGSGAEEAGPAPDRLGQATGPACVGDAPGTESATGGPTTPFARADVKAVAERITCYCGCPHLQVSNCFCGTAEQIRTDIASRLDAGQAPDAIVDAYIADHGTWILAVPPRKGFNWIIWIGPFVLVGAGAVTLLLLGRRWAHPAPAAVPSQLEPEAEARYRAQLAREVDTDA